MYKLLSTGTQRLYREYAWKASTAKVLPSETYLLYGMPQMYIKYIRTLTWTQAYLVQKYLFKGYIWKTQLSPVYRALN